MIISCVEKLNFTPDKFKRVEEEVAVVIKPLHCKLSKLVCQPANLSHNHLYFQWSSYFAIQVCMLAKLHYEEKKDGFKKMCALVFTVSLPSCPFLFLLSFLLSFSFPCLLPSLFLSLSILSMQPSLSLLLLLLPLLLPSPMCCGLRGYKGMK